MVWSFRRLLKPILYQGPKRTSPYFEGWYFKQVSAAGRKRRTISVVPGIARTETGDRAFVQVLQGPRIAPRCFEFPIESFSCSDDPFGIRIGENRFALDGMDLRLEGAAGSVRGRLRYVDPVAPRNRMFSRGIMGPMGFAPFMECHHGIASLHHSVGGELTIDGEVLSFDEGSGYIEKNWGRSIPATRIWMQSNDFHKAAGAAAFTFNLTRVPWMGSYFNGLICLLWIGGIEYRFASYSGARVELLELSGRSLRILLSDKVFKLEVQLRVSSAMAGRECTDSAEAAAAYAASRMLRSVSEPPDGQLRVVLKRRRRSTEDIVADLSSSFAAAEIAGDVAVLAP